MNDDRTVPRPPSNVGAVLSLGAGILTLASLCIAFVPIPFTGYVCFPSALGLALFSLASGLIGLRNSRRDGAGGRGMAIAGTIIGALVVVSGLCVGAVALAFWPRIAQALQPLWPQ